MPRTCIFNLTGKTAIPKYKCSGYSVVRPGEPSFDCNSRRSEYDRRQFTDRLQESPIQVLDEGCSGATIPSVESPMETPRSAVTDTRDNLFIRSSIMRRRKMQNMFSASKRRSRYAKRNVVTALPPGFRSCECNLPVKEGAVVEVGKVVPPAGPKVINVKLHLKLIPEQPKVMEVPPIRTAGDRAGGPCGWDCSRFGPMFEQMLGVLKDIDQGVHDLKNNQVTFFKACRGSKKSQPEVTEKESEDASIVEGTEKEKNKKHKMRMRDQKHKEKTKDKKKEKGKKKEKDEKEKHKKKEDDKKEEKVKKREKDKKDHGDKISLRKRKKKDEKSDDSSEQETGVEDTETDESHVEAEKHDKKSKKSSRFKKSKKSKDESVDESNNVNTKVSWSGEEQEKEEEGSDADRGNRQAGGSENEDSLKTIPRRAFNSKGNVPKSRLEDGGLWRKLSTSLSGECCFSGLTRRKKFKSVDFVEDKNDEIIYRWPGYIDTVSAELQLAEQPSNANIAERYANPPVRSSLSIKICEKAQNESQHTTGANHMTSTTTLKRGQIGTSTSILIRTHDIEQESPSLNISDSKVGLHGSISTPETIQEAFTAPFSSIIASANLDKCISTAVVNSEVCKIEEEEPCDKRLSGGYESNDILKENLSMSTDAGVSETPQNNQHLSTPIAESLEDAKLIMNRLLFDDLVTGMNDLAVIKSKLETLDHIGSQENIDLQLTEPIKSVRSSWDGHMIGTEILETILEHFECAENVAARAPTEKRSRHRIDIISPANAIEEIFARRKSVDSSSQKSALDEAPPTPESTSTSEEMTPSSSGHLVTYSKSRRRIWASSLLRDLITESEEALLKKSPITTPVGSVIRVDKANRRKTSYSQDEESNTE